ncbi:FkbM family methyltransferase [Flavobacterium sp.]|uniref:FkbM family methyltransferase n=1 Tax=Flavobacterium sp. TaxID=239 RepID=UPI0037509234
MKENYFSQFKQDKFINEVIFYNKKFGFFIDIGAHDGVNINNSLFFERYRNWKGICIEPNPNVYKELVKNRKAININKCIGNENKKVMFTQITGYSEMLSGITDNYHSNHVERIDSLISKKGGIKSEIEIDMITLDTIEEAKNNDIDFISIDTEGNEYDIVTSINFKLLNVKCLVIENNYNDNRISSYLQSSNFKLIFKLDTDDIYVNNQNLNFGIKERLFRWKLKDFYKRVVSKILRTIK